MKLCINRDETPWEIAYIITNEDLLKMNIYIMLLLESKFMLHWWEITNHEQWNKKLWFLLRVNKMYDACDSFEWL